MTRAKCHCGNVTLTVVQLPSSITSCNCSICNRLGALWAYYTPDKVTIEYRIEPTSAYLWGDEYIAFHHCPICGCSTHYETTEKCEEKRVGVNCRMMKPEVIAAIPVRHFDGAVTWKFIEE